MNFKFKLFSILFSFIIIQYLILLSFDSKNIIFIYILHVEFLHFKGTYFTLKLALKFNPDQITRKLAILPVKKKV